MNYGEYNPEFSEYNPRSAELEKELRRLVEQVETPSFSPFQGFMKKIMLKLSTQN